MASKVDYFASLSRAVAGLDRESYASRGAAYDREHKALMRRLYSADPPHSDAEIEREQQAFRDAIRRIEFGTEDDEIAVIPEQRSASVGGFDVVTPLPPRRAERDGSAVRASEAQRRPLRDPPAWAPRQSSTVSPSQIESALEAALSRPSEDETPSEEPADTDALLQPKRRSVAGRVLGRAVFAAMVLAIGIGGYGILSGDITVPWLSKVLGTRTVASLPGKPEPQPVILFDGNRPDMNGTKFDGKAFWRMGRDSAATDAAPVVQVDLEVPGRKVVLAMSMRREAPGSSMSHIFELHFLREDKQPDPDIANIAGIVMTTADMTRPALLVGRVVNVTPGVFLFGLSAQDNEREQNLRNFKDLAWIGIPMTYRNGAAGVLTFAKGSDGERVINEVLRRWAAPKS
jgi:hypothetical protein